MFHLFSKIYMDYDFNLEAGNRIIISNEFSEFVFAEDGLGYIGYLGATYNDLVTNSFGGNEQDMWGFLTSLPENTDLTIYCDETAFNTILVKYFKALFPSITSTDLYMLYRLTLNKFKMVHSQIAHEHKAACETVQALPIMSEEDFTAFATPLGTVAGFDLSVKTRVGMEYLIAAKLSDQPSDLEDEFNTRTEKMIWKNVAWEINEFKRNILNGFYDLDSLYPELDGIMNYGYTTLDEVIAVVPELAFLQDIECNPNNLDYIRATYNVADIFKAYFKLLQHAHGDAEAIDGFLRAHAHYTGTLASVFPYSDEFTIDEGDMDALLDLEVNLKFGTLLYARTEYRKKMNPHVISYFYHLKRTGDMDTLNRFRAA